MRSRKAAARARPQVTDADYAALAAFRRALRQFLAFSQSAARAAGLPPQQHQALLVIKGRASAPAMTVGKLAEDLLIAPHTATELVERLVEGGLLTKRKAPAEARRVELALTGRAEAILHSLSEAHLTELGKIGPLLTAQLKAIQSRR
jgi:DNA-binding MarR family transcriptional regulator